MFNVIVKYDDGDERFKGTLVTQDIFKTTIKLEDGATREVDSEYVTTDKIEIDKEEALKYITHAVTHYTEAEITEVERDIVFKALDTIAEKLHKK